MVRKCEVSMYWDRSGQGLLFAPVPNSEKDMKTALLLALLGCTLLTSCASRTKFEFEGGFKNGMEEKA